MTNKSILIVDDNPVNLRLIKVILTIEKYDVITAMNADEALQILQERIPHLILMDIQLPGMDGLQLTKMLKADPRYKHISILAVTAYAMKVDREKILSAGCDGYIAKPIDIQGIITEIGSYFNEECHE